MSHVNVPVPSVSRAAVKSYRIKDLSGGICITEDDEAVMPSAFPVMRNLISRSGLLRTREGLFESLGGLPSSGTYYSRTDKPFFGNIIIHVGTALYAMNLTSQTKIYEEMPEAESFVVEMNSKLYFFARNYKIYIVDKDYNVTVHELPEVDYIKDAKSDLSSYTLIDEPDNMLVGVYNVTYLSVNAGVDTFTLPFEPDEEYTMTFYNSVYNSQIYPINYTVSGNVVTVDKKLYSAVKIKFMPKKGGEHSNYEKIFGCRQAVCYGGEGSAGNRVFFTGNPDFPGYYFYSDLLDPLTVPLLSYDIIGNGSENLNALIRCRKDLIAFSDSRTDRITYSFDIDTGASFTVTEISSKIGCDMPGSIQIIDNRPVFAHSGKGIFIIVSSDYTDEMSVRSISANVNGTDRHLFGFVRNSRSKKECCSVDFERTYRLFVGAYTYVWDYGNTPYVMGTDPSYSEKSLSWYIFDLPKVMDVVEMNGSLCCRCNVSNMHKYGIFDKNTATDFGAPIDCYVSTGNIDFSMPEAKKLIGEINLTILSTEADTEIYLNGDGEMAWQTSVLSDYGGVSLGGGPSEGLRRVRLIVPRYEAVRFSLMIRCRGAMAIKDVLFKLIGDGIYCR